MFWGTVLVLMGMFIVLNAAFGIQIPILKILIGFFVVYVGAKMAWGPRIDNVGLCGPFCEPTVGKVMFHSAHLEPKNLSDLSNNEFSTIFASGELDLTKAGFESHSFLKINTVFAKVKVLLPKNVNIIPKVNSVAGSVRLPGEANTFGAKTLNVEVNNVFGSTQIDRE